MRDWNEIQSSQFSVVKISAAAFGLLIGYYFADFWKPLVWLVWVVFIIASIWASLMWFKEMGKK